jgi:hypothetical protein
MDAWHSRHATYVGSMRRLGKSRGATSMKPTIKSTETTKRKIGEITFAQLCEAFDMPGDTDASLRTKSGVVAIGPDDVIDVSFVEQVKPRARKAAEK